MPSDTPGIPEMLQISLIIGTCCRDASCPGCEYFVWGEWGFDIGAAFLGPKYYLGQDAQAVRGAGVTGAFINYLCKINYVGRHSLQHQLKLEAVDYGLGTFHDSTGVTVSKITLKITNYE
jgi:hypothetical protein